MISRNKNSGCSWWTYLLAFLLLGIVFTIVFGGYRSFIDYKNAIDPGLKFNIATLRFFTKEYIQRKYFGLIVDKLPENTEFPSFHIFTDEQDLESLESDLPASGKTRFIPGHIQVDKPEFESAIQFRYRGGLPLHWLYEKKSLRIKLPPFTTYRGERQFNLVNPSTVHTITDWVSYNMSRSLGLLTPEYFPARVYINNATNGLHFFLSRIDESFLRKNKRMPGSIYSGDTIYVPNPFGSDKTGYETVFQDDEGLPRIWKDERLWDKGAARNAQSKNDRTDIQKFIEIINQKSPVEFMKLFETYFDKEKFYLFWGLDTLVGSYHHDLFHNHKLYFDPYKGKFEPIEWDLRFWSSLFYLKDIAMYPILKQVALNPVLEHERDLISYKLLDQFPVDEIVNDIEQANLKIRPELAADPMRHAPDHRYGRFSQDKEVPFSMAEYDAAIGELKLGYENRQKFLNGVFDYVKAEYSLTEEVNEGYVLTVSVNGNSAISFDPWQIIPSVNRSKVSIHRQFQDQIVRLEDGKSALLYPGRKISPGNVFNRTDGRSVLSYGKDKLLWSPLRYKFLIRGTKDLSQDQLGQLTSVNAITGIPIDVDPVVSMKSDEETSSIHPWELRYQYPAGKSTKVTLAGEIKVMEDQIYSSSQTVTILPGTVFKIAPGKSLVFYGKVMAEGQASSPIIFKPLIAGKPWGSVVIQGKAASGSQLNYINVAGGSISKHQLISYPGQLNIHDLELFSLSNCHISSNKIGDDALHVAYSKGTIKNCRFEDTAFDALDMDITEVTVSDSQFTRSGNDALDLMTSKTTIANVSIDGAGDKCISAGEESEVLVKDSKLMDCQIGIAIKDQSKGNIERSLFKGIRGRAISLYQKNPRYGLGGTINGQQLIGISEQDIELDERSISMIPKEEFVSNSTKQ